MKIILTCLFGLASLITQASHLRGGEIIIEQTNCLSVKITLNLYVNTASPIQPGDGTLFFGDGSFFNTPNAVVNVIDSYNNVGKVTIIINHTYATTGSYLINYSEANRNAGISNITSSLSTLFYVESMVTLKPSSCKNSLQFLVSPIDRACSGKVFYHDPVAYDADGDSLSYEIFVPKMGTNTAATGYVLPNDIKFYSGKNYNTSNEAGTNRPGFQINPLTGLLTWDAPGSVGEYAVAFKVSEWRKDPQTKAWNFLGYTIRDMQILVEDCDNKRPDIAIPAELCLEAGSAIDLNITGSDPDNNNVKIEVFSTALLLEDSPPVVIHAGETQPASTSSVRLMWTPDCTHIKSNFYEFIFKITDLPSPGTRLVTFKTLRIKVIGPSPHITSVNINPIAHTAKLQWSNYLCPDGNLQIWRRVTKRNYNQPSCDTGMPSSLGYILLSELPPSATSFTDKDLSIGAQYCYRVVVKFNSPINTYSRLSADTCFIPLKAEAPIITQVSVEKTNDQTGSIRLKWTKPFDIDATQYPEPYRYSVWRSNGLKGEEYKQAAASLEDTTFIDTHINTLDSAFRYKVVLYVPTLTSSPVDTSSAASSLFASSVSLSNKIKLEWKANVPWSINTQTYPWHYIYRGDEGLDGSFALIDSIKVDDFDLSKETYNYSDISTTKNNLPLEKVFYYKIVTKGAYGNPGIQEPLINLSQVVTGHRLDTIPPLTPAARINNLNCEETLASYSCETKTFTNTISWEEVITDTDIDHYIVSIADSTNGNFVTLNSAIKFNTFTHAGISKLAYCYRIKAVDKQGNESGWSDPVCNENCPYFELPNVFTPGNDDGYNDYFNTVKCPVFVKGFLLKIFDRSGQQVYTVKKGNDTSLLWDGRDNNNRELPAGIYFYYAEAHLDVSNQQPTQKKLQGWVHLVR